jgi:hypothetical protein
VSEAQYEYETTYELRESLVRASLSPTVPGGNYSKVACDQLDAVQIDPGARYFDAVLEACVSVLAQPDQARERSDEIATHLGRMYRLQVASDPPHEPQTVFWTFRNPQGPRIEAIFSHRPTPASTPSLAGPTAPLAAAALSAAESDVSDDDWERLRDELLTKHPRCPECGAAWDFESAIEEDEGEIDGRRAISITVDCSAVTDDAEGDDQIHEDDEDDEDDDFDLDIHSVNGGWVQHLMYLDG